MILIDWNDSKNYRNNISLSEIIEKNGPLIKKYYSKLVKKITNNKELKRISKVEDYSLLDMSLILEKNYYKSPRILDALKLIALEILIKKNKDKHLKLIVSDMLVIKSVQDLCKEYSIYLELVKNKQKKTEFNIKNYIPHRIQGILFGLKYIIDRYKLIKSKIKDDFFESKILIVSYFTHINDSNLKNKRINFNQWGEIPYLFGEKISWIHHYVPNKSSILDSINLLNKINKSQKKQNHNFLDSIINLKIMSQIFYIFIKHILKYPDIAEIRKDFKINHFKANFWHLLKNDFYKSIFGITAFENIIYIKSFDAYLSKFKKLKVGLFLMENQGWEKALINAWKKYNHKKLVGYQYALIRFWDLRYHYLNISKKLMPSIIAVSSEENFKYLKKYLECPEVLERVENVRYNNKNLKLKSKKIIPTRTKKEKILILTDVNKNHNLSLLKKLEELKDYFNGYNIILKYHPSYPVKLPSSLKDKISISNRASSLLLNQCNKVIIVNGSGAIIDAYFMKKNIIVFIPNGELNYSPLRDLKKQLYFVKGNSSFEERLFNKKILKFKDYERSIYFYVSKHLSLWRTLIKKIS